jgi:hypothetical protein
MCCPSRLLGRGLLAHDAPASQLIADAPAETVPAQPSGGPLSRTSRLPLVERSSSSWGVAKDGSGLTRVWSEIVLDAVVRLVRS